MIMIPLNFIFSFHFPNQTSAFRVSLRVILFLSSIKNKLKGLASVTWININIVTLRTSGTEKKKIDQVRVERDCEC